ncbi:MAG TPA: nuclear transport factor 2 family protein [Ilumatobacter sp.]|nr:nuclear transport factor 2 family protein [Ilumatobacter sp.]
MTDRIDVAKRLYDRFNAHDIPGILALLSPDIIWNSYGPDFALAVGTYHGRDGVEQFFKDLMTQQTDSSFVPDDYWDGGSTVHVIGVEKGTLNDSQLEFVNHYDHTLWFSDGSDLVQQFRANYNLSTKGDG